MTEQVPQKTPEVPASALPPGQGQEYVEKMVAAAEGNEAPASPQANAEETPKLLAGKFKSPEELEKAYAELQKKLGEGANKKPEASQQEAPADKPKNPADPNLAIEKKEGQEAAAEEAVAKAGLDWNALSDEFAQKGELSEDSYKALADKAGIPREMVDQFIQGQVASATLARAEVISVAGGEEKFGEIIAWAKDNLSPEEIGAYNKIVQGRDVTASKMAVQGLKARFEAAAGSEPNLIGGDTKGTTAGYRSMAEMTADMAKPEYKTDPAFRAKVMDKLRASPADLQ